MRKIIKYVVLIGNVKRLTRKQDDIELEDRHHTDILESLIVKKDSTRDLLLIFSDCLKVQLTKGKTSETLKGQWCLQCKCCPHSHLPHSGCPPLPQPHLASPPAAATPLSPPHMHACTLAWLPVPQLSLVFLPPISVWLSTHAPLPVASSRLTTT